MNEGKKVDCELQKD